MWLPIKFESGAGKRITLVGCICLDGSFMRPIVVIPRHTNIQSVHITKLVAADHSACDPPNVTALFGNAGFTEHVDADGKPVAYLQVDVGSSSFWLQALEDEISRLRGRKT
jgi:hypothetical protein